MKKTRLFVCGIAALSLFSTAYAASQHKPNGGVAAQQSRLTKQVQKTDKVNLNSADAKTLADAVKGIGLVRAAAIVAYRKQHGNFKTLEQLAKVRGIGSRFIKKNRKHLDEVLAIS